MYKISVEDSFDAAHFLKDYPGKCRNIHGHRWKVIVTLSGETLAESSSERGMLTDFGNIKTLLKELTGRFDHTLIYEEGSLKPELLAMLKNEGFAVTEVPFRPTAENFAKFFFDEVRGAGFPVCEVTVYETPNNSASYSDTL